MGAEVFTDIRVFEIELPEEQAPRANDLLNTPMPLIVVFGQHYCKNTYPHTPRWSIDFVGIPEDWSKYVDYMHHSVDSGMSMFRGSRGFQRGKKIREKLESLFLQRRTLTVQDCHELEYRAYSWPHSYGFKGTPFKRFSEKKYDRTGHLIETESDLQKLAVECLEAKKFYKEDTDDQRLWLGRPWSASGHWFDLIAMRSLDQPDVTTDDEVMASSP